MAGTTVRTSNGLQVSSSRHYGRDRLEVRTLGGQRVGWYDVKSGRHELLAGGMDAIFWQAVSEARGGVSSSSAGLPSPRSAGGHQPSAWESRRSRDAGPGAGLPSPVHDYVGGPSMGKRLSQGVAERAASLLKRSAGSDQPEPGAGLDPRVDRTFAKLEKGGHWYVAHRTTYGSFGPNADHMIFGPGGAYCLATIVARGSKVVVGDTGVLVDGTRRPVTTELRAAAQTMSDRLTAAAKLRVLVTPLVVIAGASRVQGWQDHTPQGIRVMPVEVLIRWLHLRRTTTPQRDNALRLRELANLRRTWIAEPITR